MDIIARPIITILLAIYHVLFLLHVPYPLGFSIVLLTICIRFVLYPFTKSQLKASKKMQEIAPHIKKLKDKHKGDAKLLQAETMKLYKLHGINPAAGCLPLLIQLPIIWGLYSVLQMIVKIDPHTVVKEVNAKVLYFDWLKLAKPWDTSFFGLPLGQSPSQLLHSAGFLILLVPILTGVFQFIQSKMMMPPKPIEKLIEKEAKKHDDFATAFQSQSMFIFPFMIAFFSYTFSIGLSLYWNTFSIFGIIQQYQVSGWGGLVDLKDLKKKFIK